MMPTLGPLTTEFIDTFHAAIATGSTIEVILTNGNRLQPWPVAWAHLALTFFRFIWIADERWHGNRIVGVTDDGDGMLTMLDDHDQTFVVMIGLGGRGRALMEAWVRELRARPDSWRLGGLDPEERDGGRWYARVPDHARTPI
jgi:hypothetical protein